jgi:hypothetical protein
MINLDLGNVLLKPSHRRQLMSWLRRASGSASGWGLRAEPVDPPVRRIYELRGNVHDAAGDFACRARAHDWRGALRDLVKTMTRRLHDQCVRRRLAAA